MHLFHSAQPVGVPGVAAFAAGAAVFFLLLVRRSVAASTGEEKGGRKSGLSRVGILVQMAAFAVTGLGPVRATLPPASAEATGEALAVAVLMGGAAWLFAAATRAMGANWSLAARTRADHDLVTHGIFARLRHPIYAGMALFLAAEAIAFGHEPALVATLPLFGLGTWIRVREEERLLRAQFGAAYGDYAARVRRFVPGVF